MFAKTSFWKPAFWFDDRQGVYVLEVGHHYHGSNQNLNVATRKAHLAETHVNFEHFLIFVLIFKSFQAVIWRRHRRLFSAIVVDVVSRKHGVGVK